MSIVSTTYVPRASVFRICLVRSSDDTETKILYTAGRHNSSQPEILLEIEDSCEVGEAMIKEIAVRDDGLKMRDLRVIKLSSSPDPSSYYRVHYQGEHETKALRRDTMTVVHPHANIIIVRADDNAGNERASF